MGNRGQFSIIAALLVAAVLITTVIFTYSTIRNFPVQEQSKVLNAIDETNFALKQILGFTVGYYGSILQVTGERDYAYNEARKYLMSGLEYVASLHREWAASFNLSYMHLQAHWFTSQSYSKGEIAVQYNLTGLGIYGINYKTSCKLSVEVLGTVFGERNQTRIRVTVDEKNEPLINLGKRNFKFYLYKYTNSTWAMVSPSTEPKSYADGTYLIDIPQGVNPYSFVVQVEDSRGMVTVASSFSRYICELRWGLPFEPTLDDYVDNISNVDGSPDKGTHSNFAAQQYGPDGVYDTLTETASGSYPQNYYPGGYSALGSTTCVSGTVENLQSNDGVYMQLRSYPTAYSPTQYNTINFDSASSRILTSSSSSMSWQHTTGTGDDRILLVAVDIFRNDGAPTTVTSVTYDGIPLTQVATALYSTNPQVRSYIFLLVNPSSGTKTITVNFASSTLAIGGSVTYTNVNQTNPIIASNTNTGSGSSQSVSLTASGSYGKMLYGHLATYRTSSPSSYTVTEGSGQTNRWAQTDQTYKGRGSDKSVTSGSVSMSWTTSRSASWVAIAVLLQPTRLAIEYTCEAEFSGSSDTFDWEGLTWAIDSSATTTDVGITFQLYNYAMGAYPTSGNGYLTANIGTSDITISQTITSSPTSFRSSAGLWKFKFKAVKATSTRFDIKIDMSKFSPKIINYALDLEGQWTNVNYTNPFQYLCIKTGVLGSENLAVDVRSGSHWIKIINSLQPNTWNNVSVAPYINSSVFTIRFRGSNDVSDPVQDSWDIDAVLLSSQPSIGLISSLQDATFVIELLQNGTMRWLGQNLQLTTQALPIPPIPVKAIHVNQTINGVNHEVPFQIEDWASEYRIPLGLTNNASVFNNRNMIVFLANPNVSKVTIWWNGSDTAKQTPLAYTNKHFTTSNTNNSRTIKSNLLELRVDWSIGDLRAISKVGSITSTAVLMRINNKVARWGSSAPAIPIPNGPVRSVLHHEVEWGPSSSYQILDCPNFYAHIVLTLPANATYYTYQLRLMFLDSTGKPRTIKDLCPIQINVGQVTEGVFGNSAAGSYYTVVNASQMYGSVFSFSTSSGVFAKSISFYSGSISETANVKCLIVRHSDMHIIAETDPILITESNKWWTATFPSPPVLSPSTEYVLMIIPDGQVRFYGSTDPANPGHYDEFNNYDTPIDPTDALHNNYRYSIYCSYSSSLQQTENGKLNGCPIVANQPGIFYNSPSTGGQHHWSQIISSSAQGVGIMFTDSANQMLYVFDSIAGATTGALNITSRIIEPGVASKIIELSPVTSMASVGSFISPLDVAWYGAVVTFDDTNTPIYKSDGGGLWIIIEYPPKITVKTES